MFVDGDESVAAGRLLGFWACVCQACFAFCGTEVVGITFSETPNPRRNIPRAIRQTFWRIGVFYILAVFVLGMAVPYDSDRLIGATKQATSGGESLSLPVLCLCLSRVKEPLANPSSRLPFRRSR